MFLVFWCFANRLARGNSGSSLGARTVNLPWLLHSGRVSPDVLDRGLTVSRAIVLPQVASSLPLILSLINILSEFSNHMKLT